MSKAFDFQYRADTAEVDPDTGRYAESRTTSRMTVEQKRLVEIKRKLANLEFERELQAIECED